MDQESIIQGLSILAALFVAVLVLRIIVRNLPVASRAEAAGGWQGAAWPGFRPFRVIAKAQECADITSFYLEPVDGEDLPPFKPGQHLTLRLAIPGEERPVIRCYTLSDRPRARAYRLSIKRHLPDGKASGHMHDRVAEGSEIEVKAPSGHFFLDEDSASPVVLIAGGIGLTPMLAMLNQLAATRSDRQVWLFYGVRNGAHHIMKGHLAALATAHPNFHVRVCYSQPRADDVEGEDYDLGERVTVDLLKRLLPENRYEFYACGPPAMMPDIVNGLRDWGIDEDRIHFEAFGPSTVSKPGDAEPRPPARVTFLRSGREVEWTDASGSLLDLAEANGVEIPSGCRAGNCGTCQTVLANGNVDYTAEPGEHPEPGLCLPCIAVPAGKIELDA